MTCPACRADNRQGARFCDSCGAPLPRQCPACGTAARPTARFCDECGRDLGAPRGTGAAAAGAAAAGAGAASTATMVPSPPLSPAEARSAPSVGSASPAVAAVSAPPAGYAPSVASTPAPAGYTPRHLAEKILTSRSALEGERKQVTVLFVDCVGFTALSSRLDPEDLHTIMDGCFSHLLDAVHRYEGTVNQFTGDGVMALFGAPIAHEDHAVRAVAAALAIQAAAQEYAESLRRERGVDFAVRVGLNTGPVVVGKIGDDLRMDYTAQGETVNLAARLQQAAAAGGILVSDATHRLVSAYFITEDRGLLSLKGLERPVPAFAVTGQRTRRARFDVALERGLTPLAGRQRELGFLRECLDRVRAGRGQVVSVVGEAGVGKSRLAYELRREAAGAPFTYLEGHCLPHGTSLPFHLVIQFLQSNFRLEEGEREEARLAKVDAGIAALDPSLAWTLPYLKHLLSLPAPELESEGLDQGQRKRRVIDAVKALVLRGALYRPLFLVVEDLQWIDRNSEECFAVLVDSLAGYPVLLVSTYRTGYAPLWQDRSFHQRVALEPLTDDETEKMVGGILGVTSVAPALRDLVAKRAEGNPFFIEELTTYLRERELLSTDGDGVLAQREVAEGEVPATIHDLLTARIDRLPDALKRTLQLASVLGREFPLSLLEAIAPGDYGIKSQLNELVRMELVHEKDLFPEVRYRFTHLLTQQVAYQGLLLKARAELHARAGRALEQLHGDRLEEALPEIAEHYARSPERGKALPYLVRAGDRAARLFAYEEAEAWYGRALGLVTPAAERERSIILEKLGDAVFARGALPEARRHWADALALTGADAPRRLAELHRKMGAACWAAGARDETLAHLEAGLAAAAGDQGNLETARLYQEFGRVHFRLGDHERAVEWAERARALGEALGAPDVVSHASNTLGVALARAGDIERGAQYVARSLETALAHQLGAVACRAYTNLAVMYATLDPARAAEYCRDGLALAQKIGDQLQQSWLYCALASGHCTLAGDYDEGVRAAEAAVELDRRLGQRNHLPTPLILLAQIYQCRGDQVRSEHYYREALGVAEEVGEPQLVFPCYDGLATLAIERGDEREAERWLVKSREVQDATGWSSDTFLVLPFLC